ncbi:MAG: VWA domain-containing protein [Bacteroidota bacterium]
MRLTPILAVLFLLGSLVFTTACKKDDDQPEGPATTAKFYRLDAFEVDVEPSNRLVKILFQVKDYENNGIAGLTADDFDVYENAGKIDLESDLRIAPDSIPYRLKTVLLLDLSRSVEGFVDQIKAASIALVNKKLSNQEVAIYTFDAQATLIQDFTTRSDKLIEAINNIPETGLTNSTNLYGAIQSVSNLWTDIYTTSNIEDGSLVIFTDGRHNATPNITLNDAMNSLSGKKRYIAALSSGDLDEDALRTLAQSDNNYYQAEDVASIEQMFLSIQEEISSLSNSVYYMFYQSPITDPTPFENELRIEIFDNANTGNDGQLIETFNSAGFGQ